MKKLKLQVDGKQMLSKEQMKRINGGYFACLVTFIYGPGCPTDGPEMYVCTTATNPYDCYYLAYSEYDGHNCIGQLDCN